MLELAASPLVHFREPVLTTFVARSKLAAGGSTLDEFVKRSPHVMAKL